jgi:hypothetical protein
VMGEGRRGSVSVGLAAGTVLTKQRLKSRMKDQTYWLTKGCMFVGPGPCGNDGDDERNGERPNVLAEYGNSLDFLSSRDYPIT